MIEPARLAFAADGTPWSEIYGDVYHTAAGGLGQARHVFLAGNGLPQRWAGRERFVVLETGFGLGLNFLATWAAWRDDPQRGATLHYVALEMHPFAAADLAQLHAAWPELAPLAAELRARWPLLVPGLHRLRLDAGRVVLDLVLGDATECLPRLALAADAFYLDGFAPAKNPALWDAPLLAALRGLAAPGATLATWSVAGGVRETLAASGWQLEKAPGYAGKREMLRGTLAAAAPAASPAGGHARVASGEAREAIVLGAGLAGTTTANRLAARGWRVTLLDAAAGPGQGASGNHAGVLRPLPARDDGVLARVIRAGFLAASRHLDELVAAGLEERLGTAIAGRVGALHLGRDATHEATQRLVVEQQRPPADYLRWVGPEEAGELCGWPVDAGGWWFPGGGWVAPAAYCRANLLQYEERIATRFDVRVERIEHDGERWHALDAGGIVVASAPQLVVANAADARRLLGDWLPVFPARGQVSHLPAEPGSPPRCVVCRLGYVTPEVRGRRCAGATFLMRDEEPGLRLADHEENLAKLNFMLPGYADGIDPTQLDGRVGFRPASPDRLPIVGAVPRLGAAAAPPGLWLVNGFGARGIVWSALAAELLADQLDGSPAILDAHLGAALAPARFLAPRRRPRDTARSS